MTRILTYTKAIREALDQCMERDESVFVMGLGADYVNGCDGTTAGLVDKYPGRVFDTPCSENSTTGFCIGSALAGMRPIIYHGRVEFALFAFDQIATQASKWNYMFGNQSPMPVVIRIAVGRRWGDAPQHTSVMHSVFGHIPGLGVVIPSTPRAAKGLLISSINSNNPVVFLEHRWLYNMKETVPEIYYKVSLDSCWVMETGKDITIVANSDTLIEALKADKILRKYDINAEIIDLVSVNPIDYETILMSMEKTRMLLVLDVGTKAFGIGSEIISHVCEHGKWAKVASLAAPDCPCPMSPSLAESYYPTADDIIDKVSEMFRIEIKHERRTDFNRLHLPSDENVDILLRRK